MAGIFSESLLKAYEPLGRLIHAQRWQKNATECTINGPENVYIYVAGRGKVYLKKKEIEFLDQIYINDLFLSLANAYGVRFSPQMPILACKTPDGDRLLGITGPTVDEDHLACSIRIKRKIDVKWEDYLGYLPKDEMIRKTDRIRQAIADGKTVLVLGGTNAGKTTVLNLAAKDVPIHNRVVTVEDTRELDFANPDRRHLIYSRYDSNLRVTAADLIDAVVRLNPDDFWMSELSIRNAGAAVQVMDTGHSFCATSHANSPIDGLRGWRRRVALGGGADVELGAMMDLFADNVDLIIQVKQMKGENGVSDERRITDVVSAKEALDRREVREELRNEPVFPGMPEPQEMRRVVEAMNAGKPLSETQEEALKITAAIFSLFRPANNNPGLVQRHEPSLDPIEQMQLSAPRPMTESDGPVFQEVAS
ncbi:ATPase, T2SS/T4P/T4SS family [Thalassospira lucentensis]|uniref:ATPase, T2SS/T4P/T4SS family n=1 Tax=Thalassospira lucentensis TaxID=168935 RepID=UPI0029439913|nr:ATPase, T2SS/T4P/T4SS family [Thalassospira lucentensis]WOI09023.1 ATPase, T2SS/T4P/T4SS family [Thalassospira lucentensis]